MHGVLTLAGEGTRMLPWSRGLRKEFLPLLDRSVAGKPVLKPVAHVALESLVRAGAEQITLVVARRDEQLARSYFSVDSEFLDRHSHHPERLADTEAFYSALGRLRIKMVVQPEPRGFGDAVLRASASVGREPFLLHAADAVLLEHPRGRTLKELGRLREREDLDAVLLVRRVADPSKYGVVEGRFAGRFGRYRRLEVTAMEEKPTKPKSPWAATAVYALSPQIFDVLRQEARIGHSRELELTAGISRLIRQGGKVSALVLPPSAGKWSSVGSVEGYLRALHRSKHAAESRTPARPSKASRAA
jgi:UTP--glucose-1-phosphate uridylyltransferase